MSRLAEVQAFLDRFSYKPGAVLRITAHEDTVRLLMTMDAPDVSKPGNPTTSITMSRYIRFDDLHPFNRDVLAREVKILVYELERHETAEWLKFDGVCIDDPHANCW